MTLQRRLRRWEFFSKLQNLENNILLPQTHFTIVPTFMKNIVFDQSEKSMIFLDMLRIETSYTIFVSN
jgi:hypothetical protein